MKRCAIGCGDLGVCRDDGGPCPVNVSASGSANVTDAGWNDPQQRLEQLQVTLRPG
jgi:hypothetical protein